MKKIYRERLLKLARMLVADAKRKKGIKFDLRTVGESSTRYSTVEFGWEPKLDCGTTACAIGLAAISGEFKRAGLSYEVTLNSIVPSFKGTICSYISAAEDVFGVTTDEAIHLFSPGSYSKTKGASAELTVAKRIREVIKNNTPKKRKIKK